HRERKNPGWIQRGTPRHLERRPLRRVSLADDDTIRRHTSRPPARDGWYKRIASHGRFKEWPSTVPGTWTRSWQLYEATMPPTLARARPRGDPSESGRGEPICG